MRRWYVWLGQLVLIGAVAVFVWRSLARSLSDLESVSLPGEVRWSLVALSALTVLVTYSLLIAAWQSILRGWGDRLGFQSAARIWCLSNLGRYVPGKVWAFAGMAILAEREGIKGWVALAGALVMQFLALGTGASVALMTVAGSQTEALRPALVVTAIALAAATAVGLSTRPAVAWLDRLTSHRFNLRPVAPRGMVIGAVASLASWLSYGFAFWLLSRALVPDARLTLAVATGVFAAGYIVGLLAVVVPGGLGVREGVLLTLLTPWVGIPAAGIVVVASRLMLTLTELTAALGALVLTRGRGSPSIA